MAGLLPFQFSSGKRQYEVSAGIETTSVLASLGLDAVIDVIGWYEMWINPHSLQEQNAFRQTQQHTAGAIITQFFRPENTVINCSGKCGWVRIHSIVEELKSGMISAAINSKISTKDVLHQAKDSIKEAVADYGALPWNQKSSHANRFNNSPLLFLKRLQSMALEPMYYIDDEGVEHFNPKYIKCFTKKHPDGVIYQGFFNTFNIQEDVDLGETLAYEFSFTIEKETPVTLVQRILGAYAGFGSAIGDTIATIS